jgi:hypothetical protein
MVGTQAKFTGVGFKPDFVWIKRRNLDSSEHAAFDTTRGAGNYLTVNTNLTHAEYFHSTLLNAVIGTNGFTVGKCSNSKCKW